MIQLETAKVITLSQRRRCKFRWATEWLQWLEGRARMWSGDRAATIVQWYVEIRTHRNRSKGKGLTRLASDVRSTASRTRGTKERP